MATPEASVGAPGSGQAYPVVRARREERGVETLPSTGGALVYYAVRCGCGLKRVGGL